MLIRGGSEDPAPVFIWPRADAAQFIPPTR